MEPTNHSVKRSILKSITWRIIGILLLGGLTWVFTGDIGESIAITLVFNAIRVFLYVAHEEAWERWPRLARVGRRPSLRAPPPTLAPPAAPAHASGWTR